jgi:hypothetical protein
MDGLAGAIMSSVMNRVRDNFANAADMFRRPGPSSSGGRQSNWPASTQNVSRLLITNK